MTQSEGDDDDDSHYSSGGDDDGESEDWMSLREGLLFFPNSILQETGDHNAYQILGEEVTCNCMNC